MAERSAPLRCWPRRAIPSSSRLTRRWTISHRRQGFYERAGYHANPYAHVHPPYHAANRGHALVVMSYPGALSADTYAAFADYLQHTVMAGESDD